MKNINDPIENQIKARTAVSQLTVPPRTPVRRQAGTISLV